MRKNIFTIAVSIGLMMFFACSRKEIKLQTPVQDEKSGKWGYADSTGKVVVSFIYEEADVFKDGLARVKQDGKYGFIERAGNVVVPLIYGNIEDFTDGISKAMLDGKYGYLDKSGKEITQFIYEEAGTFQDGLVKVKLNGKQGFIDHTGKEVIPLKYDEIGDFKEGILKAKLEGKYGYLNKSGEEIIPFIYDFAENFSTGKAKVQQNNKSYFINKDGDRLPDEMTLQFVYRQTGQSINGTPFAKISGFVLKDKHSEEELKYRRLVINGMTVTGSRCYSESGINGMNVAEFSFGGGRYIKYSVPLMDSKTFKYKLENGTLTVLN
jgi:hypothetical protein